MIVLFRPACFLRLLLSLSLLVNGVGAPVHGAHASMQEPTGNPVAVLHDACGTSHHGNPADVDADAAEPASPSDHAAAGSPTCCGSDACQCGCMTLAAVVSNVPVSIARVVPHFGPAASVPAWPSPALFDLLRPPTA